MFLPLSWSIVVLWLHILSATIWIGGQITLVTLVPVLRQFEGMATAVGLRFQRIAWIAFTVLVLIGIGNMHNAGIGWTDLSKTAIGRTLSLKLGFVLISGLGAAVHAYYLGPRAGGESRRTTRVISGVAAGLGLVAAVIAALYGVDIAEH